MATTKEYYEYVMECLNKAGEVTSRKMMGEYCLYFDGKLFGDICDNRLLVKQTETSKNRLKLPKGSLPTVRLNIPTKEAKLLCSWYLSLKTLN